MNRCPKCHRFGIEYEGREFWRCLWRDCLHLCSFKEIEKAIHPIRFKKFIKSITKKRRLYGTI